MGDVARVHAQLLEKQNHDRSQSRRSPGFSRYVRSAGFSLSARSQIAVASSESRIYPATRPLKCRLHATLRYRFTWGMSLVSMRDCLKTKSNDTGAGTY